MTDVYAYAKMDLEPGLKINHAVDGIFYGMVECCRDAVAKGKVPWFCLRGRGDGPSNERKLEEGFPA